MKWLIDSGASAHMTSCKMQWNVTNRSNIQSISTGDKTKLQIIGTGNIKMAIMVDGKVVKCTIEIVLHVPSLGYNLLSVGAMESKGMTASFGEGVCSIFAASKKIAQGTWIGNIYMLYGAADTGISCTAIILLMLALNQMAITCSDVTKIDVSDVQQMSQMADLNGSDSVGMSPPSPPSSCSLVSVF
jgi:hypothetical protein